MKCPECKKKMIDDEDMHQNDSSVELCLDCGIAIHRCRMDKDELEMFRQAHEAIKNE